MELPKVSRRGLVTAGHLWADFHVQSFSQVLKVHARESGFATMTRYFYAYTVMVCRRTIQLFAPRSFVEYHQLDMTATKLTQALASRS